jgi:transposase
MSKRKKRRRYSPEFKKEAVTYLLESEKTLAAVAEELGVSKTNLARWRDQLEGVEVQPEGESPEQELERLRRRVRRLEMEREILKKATAFFAKESE